MSEEPSSREQRILEEIERLKRELESRQAERRPTPSSVLRAYHTLLTDHYERLEGTASEPRSIKIP